MVYNKAESRSVNYRMLQLERSNIKDITYSDTNVDIHKTNTRRFSNLYDGNIAEQFKSMQDNVMSREIPILTRLLEETPYDIGYESLAEKYFEQLSDKYGIIADTILQNIYLQNMYNRQYLLKHLLFIVGNLPSDRRRNLELIPLAGISNPDIEIQDLSVKCFESWEDRRHLPTLLNLRDKTTVKWFKDYIDDVINGLNEE